MYCAVLKVPGATHILLGEHFQEYVVGHLVVEVLRKDYAHSPLKLQFVSYPFRDYPLITLFLPFH